MTEREEISAEIDAKAGAVREDARRRRARGAYFWIVMVAYMVAGPAFAIIVSVQNTHRSERKLCAVIVQADEAWKAAPPPSASGREQAAAMARLRRDYHCP